MNRVSFSPDYSYELFIKSFDQFKSEKMSFISALEIIKALNFELVTIGRSKLFNIICQNLSIDYNLPNIACYLRFINVSPCDILEDKSKNESTIEILFYYASLIQFQSEVISKSFDMKKIEPDSIKELINLVDVYAFEQRVAQLGSVSSTKSQFDYKTNQRIISGLEEAISLVYKQMQQMESKIIEKQNSTYYNKLISIYSLVSDIYYSINTSKHFIKNKESLKNKNNMKQIMDMISEYLSDYGIEVLISEPSSKFNAKTQRPLNQNTQFNPQNALIERSYRAGFKLDDQIIEKEIVVIKP